MIISEQLRQYITGAIKDYYAKGYRSISILQLRIVVDNLCTESEFMHLSGREIGQAVHQVAREVIA